MPNTTSAAPARGKTNTAESVVRRFLDAFGDRDMEAVEALLHPDLVYTNVSLPSIRGGAKVARLFRGVLARGGAAEICIHHIASAGNVVLTERTDLLQLGPVRVRFWVCGTFEVRDGRIVVWRDYFDWMNFSAATTRGLLGALLPALRPRMPSS